jgi:hypothetical protein
MTTCTPCSPFEVHDERYTNLLLKYELCQFELQKHKRTISKLKEELEKPQPTCNQIHSKIVATKKPSTRRHSLPLQNRLHSPKLFISPRHHKPQEPKYVKVIMSYFTKQKAELSLQKNEIILVIQENNSGWLKGESKLSGKTGYFPSNYVSDYLPKYDASKTCEYRKTL